jgi:hypothetical protein
MIPSLLTDGCPKMDQERSVSFAVRRATDARFYVTRDSQPICLRSGAVLYFETERDAEEFLAEIGDVVVH